MQARNKVWAKADPTTCASIDLAAVASATAKTLTWFFKVKVSATAGQTKNR